MNSRPPEVLSWTWVYGREATVVEDRGRSLAARKILIVEDEFFLADDLKRVLIEQGAVIVGPTNTVDRARKLLAEHPVDLAVLDINLHGLTIFPLADDLRRDGIPFVFLTGYDSAMIPAEYHDVERWEKPAELAPLVEHLARM